MSDIPDIEDVIALTPLQAGMHALATLSDGVDVYTMQFVVQVTGALDTERLRSAAEALLARHANLRASVWDTDVPQPVQIVPTHAELPWAEFDCTEADFDAYAKRDSREPFDLRRGPLLRIAVARLGSHEWRFLFTAHHIVMDGWAMAVFFRELIALYEADDVSVLPPVRPFRDYVAWLAGQDTSAALDRWHEYLDGAETTTLADAPVRPGEVPGSETVRLTEHETAELLAWGRARGLTPSTLAQFAWAAVLSRLTGSDDVAFGTTVAGRPQALDGVETMVGLFLNAVPARVCVDDGEPVAAALKRTQAEAARMREIGYVPLQDVTRGFRGGLFDTLFVFENAPIGDATATVTTAEGTSFRPLAMESLAHYPLSVVALIDQGRLTIVAEATETLAQRHPPRALGERILAVLRAMPTAETVGDLPVATPDDALPQADRLPVPRSLPELFAVNAARTPHLPALSTNTDSWTYGELAAEAGALQELLIEHGVAPGQVIGISLPRDHRIVAAVLAVLGLGAAYVPLAPDLPSTRVASMVDSSGAVVILTEPHRTAELEPHARTIAYEPADGGYRAREVHPDDAAYVVFTSGSTGEPKGVVGTHGALAAYFADHVERMYRPAQARLGRPLCVAHGWSFGFDASWQPLLALFAGHSMRLLDDDETRDAAALITALRTSRVDMIDTSPSMFAQLVAAGLVDTGEEDEKGGHHLAVLALGGEAIPAHLWDRLAALPDTIVHNCYGPTEATVEAVVARVADTAEPRIGRPTAGTAAYVLDARLRPVPRGGAGELYLAGPQVARGYVGRPDLTAGRFVADPHRPGGRMYRTGDVVRVDPGGNIAYLGRSDDQVKIRGYRIELGDIESAIARVPGVTAAAVTVVRGAHPQLVGFATGPGLDPARVRGHVATGIPAYMVPTRIEVLAALPLTSNGKVDGGRLALLAQQALAAAASKGATPTTDTERAVAAVCAELWPGAGEDVRADFFDLGMDSIVAIAAVGALRRAGLDVTPRMVLAHPTIETLAAAIDAGVTARGEGSDAVDMSGLPSVARTLAAGGYERYGQAGVVRLPHGITRREITDALDAVLEAHPALRATVEDGRLLARPDATVRADDLLTEADDFDPAALVVGARRMVAAIWLRRPEPYLVLAVHHLAADAVSWQVLLTDLADAAEGRTPLPEVTSAAAYADFAGTPPLPAHPSLSHADTAATLRTIRVALTPDETSRLVQGDVEARLRDALGTATGIAREEIASAWHGRDDKRHGTDTSRTVGWFTDYRTPSGAPAAAVVNYLGRRDLAPSDGPWRPVLRGPLVDALPAHPEPDLPVAFPLEVIATVLTSPDGPAFTAEWRYVERLIDTGTAERQAAEFAAALVATDSAPADRTPR
ncbi:amino acid adenylation domain-containing protein [Tsukamurella sp. 8F]|uniref:non-ribosomal peptide synthetase n=1 Tax=unclassified Tsukamurella TaxID=2633480 RepID=UPI0023B9753F|nr:MULTISPECIES: amino acid adenylation domain-containing protein [unclassified Tsukamurella]MDF0529306.1 amino acid adenylation domain-containing protein [Tsukamurella sp. 8J]MDF0587187.1 amino acid adenylation domain-containing protein [Tsukamurella sp. 8F]